MLEARLPGEMLITSDIQMMPPLWQKQRRTKETLGESERGVFKVGLKFNIQKVNIVPSVLITSWQIDSITVEIVRNFFFWGGAENHCKW